MPVPEKEKSPTEILNNWESVGLSEEGTFKYVLIDYKIYIFDSNYAP